MDTLRYYVIKDDGGWTIQSGGEISDPFATCEEVVDAANALARIDQQRGWGAEIVVLGNDNAFHLQWKSSGRPHAEALFQPAGFAST